MSTQELLERLGGPEAIAKIVHDMYDRVLQDGDLKSFFAGVGMDHLRNMQYEFIVSALGGPIRYSGSELQAIHAGKGITTQHFTKFVNYLAEAMESNGASPEDVDLMLATIAMYKDRVVGSANVDG